MPDNYLQGFNDGYKKALEQVKNQIVSGREIAEDIYKDITEFQERDKRIKQQYT